ncbi:MAG: FG-GAP repeat domain-containing protein, partial [Candidatus Hydrogenedens sp.]
SGPGWLLPVDLDKNGEVDLVVSNRDSNNISVLLSQIDNPFSVKVDYAVGTYPRCVETMDINGDTYPDLIVANAGSGNYSLLINDTHGGFTSINTLQSHALPMKILIEDLNEDGYLDIVGLLYGELTLSTGEIANGPFASAEIYYGSQEGNFTYQKMINLGVGAIDIEKVDLNADTKKDLVFTLSGLNHVGVIYGDGKAFSRAETRPLFDGDIGTLTFGDYNEDSSNEIIICSNRNAYFRVFQVGTNLSLTEKGKWDVSDVIQSIVSVPMDNNNNSVDLVFCEKGVMGVTVYLNNGQGVFQKKGTYSIKEPTFSHTPYPSSIAVGDVNNDGNKDIVTANPGADTISVLLGDGTGAFGTAKETIVGNYPMAVKLTDVNRDGKLDLLFVSSKDPDDADDQSPSRFVCWFGNGDGTFDKTTQKRYATNGNPRGLLMIDLDRDGDLEAVTIHPTGQTVVIFGAKPDGTFVNTGSIKIGKNPKSVFSWDIDNNGYPDLISINGDSTISVVLNNGKLEFSSVYYYYAGHSPISGIPFDIDKDGIYDLILANNASNDLSFVLGRNP